MQTLLTVAEVADLLRMKPATIRAWILRRKISYVKLAAGRSVRIPESEVQRLTSVLIPARPEPA